MYYNITALTTHLYKECTNLQCILVVHSYVVGKSQLESELVLILEHSRSLFFFLNIVKWNDGLLLLFQTIVFLAKYWKLKKVHTSNTTRGEAQ